MTAIQAYILSKKIALGAVSGIANISFKDNQIIFTFNDGSSSSMNVPLPKDGVSITDVKINNENHLICTLSNNSIIDAGELPNKTGGGVIFVEKLETLPQPGETDILYLVLDKESLYYYNEKTSSYHAVGGSTEESLANKSDIDNLFPEDIPDVPPESGEDIYASETDIDNLFVDNPSTSNLKIAKKADIDKLFN